MTEREEQWQITEFPALLADVVAFDEIAERERTERKTAEGEISEYENRYARASIISAALSVEAAANCCLPRVPGFSEKLRDGLDKLTPLEKFELLAFTRGKSLDRGRPETQDIAELVKVRNDYAHPKVRKVNAKVRLAEKGVFDADWDFAEYKHLKLSAHRAAWSQDDSARVAKRVLLFFEFFFHSVCGLSTEQSNQLLTTFASGASFLDNFCEGPLSRAGLRYKVPIHFLVIPRPADSAGSSST